MSAMASDAAPSVPADVIKVVVKHGKETYKVDVSQTATVDELKEILEKVSGIDRSMQKLMFKGALKSGQTLLQAKVKNKSKLKLIGSSLKTVMDAMANQSTQPDVKIIGFEDELKQMKEEGDSGPWKSMKEHKRILDMGVPEGTGVGNKALNLRLPATPLLVRGMDGQPCRMTFRNDMMPPQLWLQSAVRTKKIPLGTVRAIKTEDTDEEGNYVIMALQIGATAKSRIFLYFVPKQYVQSLKNAIL